MYKYEQHKVVEKTLMLINNFNILCWPHLTSISVNEGGVFKELMQLFHTILFHFAEVEKR